MRGGDSFSDRDSIPDCSLNNYVVDPLKCSGSHDVGEEVYNSKGDKCHRKHLNHPFLEMVTAWQVNSVNISCHYVAQILLSGNTMVGMLLIGSLLLGTRE